MGTPSQADNDKHAAAPTQDFDLFISYAHDLDSGERAASQEAQAEGRKRVSEFVERLHDVRVLRIAVKHECDEQADLVD